jgi:hypothetical protein
MRVATPLSLALSFVSGAISATTPRSTISAEQDSTQPVLEQQLRAAREATAAYQDLEVARRAGYLRFRIGTDAPLMGEHWVNRKLLDQPVDLNHPAVLQYIRVGDRRVLVGVAYGRWQRRGDPLPEGFAGDSDRWHVHDMPRLVQQLTRHASWYVRWAAERRLQSGAVGGPDGRTQLAMLHVWLWSDNPDGIFANRNPALPYLRAGLPAEWARSGGYAAARGIQLLAPDGCSEGVARMGHLIGIDRTQEEALAASCAQAARVVAAARERGFSADTLNAVAAQAWRAHARQALATLTPDQRQELAHLVDGSMGGMMEGKKHQGGEMP